MARPHDHAPDHTHAPEAGEAALRRRGRRLTRQRRLIWDVVAGEPDGHLSAQDVTDRVHERAPSVTPSTVYRTLDVLESPGLISHSHGIDGREEFHVQPLAIHGHLHCIHCGQAWDIPLDEAWSLVDAIQRTRGFSVDVTHLSIAGTCAGCADQIRSEPPRIPSAVATPGGAKK